MTAGELEVGYIRWEKKANEESESKNIINEKVLSIIEHELSNYYHSHNITVIITAIVTGKVYYAITIKYHSAKKQLVVIETKTTLRRCFSFFTWTKRIILRVK